MQTLEQKISAGISMGFIPIEVKPHIINNLNPKFALRPYQNEAFSRFNFALNQDNLRLELTFNKIIKINCINNDCKDIIGR